MLPCLAACSWVLESLVPGFLPQNKGCAGLGTASTPSCSSKDDRSVRVAPHGDWGAAHSLGSVLLWLWQVEGVQCGKHQSFPEPPWKWKGGWSGDSRGERGNHFFVCKGSAVTVPSGLRGVCWMRRKSFSSWLPPPPAPLFFSPLSLCRII